MNDDRPDLEITLPSEEDHRLFEEWRRRQEEAEAEEDENERVIILNV